MKPLWLIGFLLLAEPLWAQQIVFPPYTFTIERTTPIVLLRVQASEGLCTPPPSIPYTRRVAGGAVVNVGADDACAPGTSPPVNLLYDLGTFHDGAHELRFQVCDLCSAFATLEFTVQGGQESAVFIAPTQPRRMKIEPGETGSLSFTLIRNNSAAIPGDWRARYYSTTAAMSEYQWTSTDPINCPPPTLLGWGLGFAGLAGPGSRTCDYEIHRNPGSLNDLSFDFCSYPSPLQCTGGHFFLG